MGPLSCKQKKDCSQNKGVQQAGNMIDLLRLVNLRELSRTPTPFSLPSSLTLGMNEERENRNKKGYRENDSSPRTKFKTAPFSCTQGQKSACVPEPKTPKTPEGLMIGFGALQSPQESYLMCLRLTQHCPYKPYSLETKSWATWSHRLLPVFVLLTWHSVRDSNRATLVSVSV